MSTTTDPAKPTQAFPSALAAPSPTPASEERLAYRLLTGPDDDTFCERVSTAIAEGYHLHGNPAATFDGTRVIVAQALVLNSPTATVVPA